MADYFWWGQHNIASYRKIYYFLIYIIDGISVNKSKKYLMVFTSKLNMEMTKSEKLLEKNEKFFGDFFRYDVIQERAWFRLS